MLEFAALVADDDPLLGIALHIDDRHDVNGRVALVKFLDDDLGGVGHLLVVGHEDLLAHDLGDKEAAAAVGEGILAEVGRALGQQLDDALHDVVHIEVLERAGGEDLGVGQELLPLVDDAHQVIVALEQIDLVDDQQDGDVLLGHAVEEVLILGGRLDDVGDIEQHVGIDERAGRVLEHALLQPEFGLEHAGRVAEHNLVILTIDDAHDAVARGLCLAGDDGQTLAHQAVAQCRFSHVGVAHDVDESCSMHLVFSF